MCLSAHLCSRCPADSSSIKGPLYSYYPIVLTLALKEQQSDLLSTGGRELIKLRGIDKLQHDLTHVGGSVWFFYCSEMVVELMQRTGRVFSAEDVNAALHGYQCHGHQRCGQHVDNVSRRPDHFCHLRRRL